MSKDFIKTSHITNPCRDGSQPTAFWQKARKHVLGTQCESFLLPGTNQRSQIEGPLTQQATKPPQLQGTTRTKASAEVVVAAAADSGFASSNG